MPGTFILDGQARTTLCATTNLSVAGSHGLGVFPVTKYSRFAGLLSVIGSVTVRYRFGVDSGAFQVSSSFVVNSGAATFDVLNFGRHVDWSLTAANSQVVNGVLIYGEPLR